ncbi:ATP-grasp ribosomal peptide maturase [Streptomyces sp. NPDC088789]|uniref:ATP-grasp ribosomal peptide maturase n=1 Tax=Streptomyces sp. NPDC088789 TaxID=3365899 RepID=UPI003820E04D
MPGAGQILVLAGRFDPTCDLVVNELNRRGVPVFRADMADFPLKLTLAASLHGHRWNGTLASDRRTLDLASVRSVYYRRPIRPRLPEGMSAATRKVAETEARLGFGGLLTALPCRWLPPPGKAADAEYKPLQLRVAAQTGLSVPQTLITNDPGAARDFADTVGGPLVYKPFFPVRGTVDGQSAAVYASIVQPGDLPHPDIATTAHLFQEWVPKAHEVRLTAVGTTLFAAEIHAGSEAGHIDWRSDYDSHRYQVCEPPAEVTAGVLRMLGVLGLPYGAFDFVVTPEGDWRFLEVNPSGQYGFIEQATGLPITAAICDYLEGTGP